jgi:hypothetical protein
VRGELLRGPAVYESHVDGPGVWRGNGEDGVRPQAQVGQRGHGDPGRGVADAPYDPDAGQDHSVTGGGAGGSEGRCRAHSHRAQITSC